MNWIDIGGFKASYAALGSTDFGGTMSEGVSRDVLDAYFEAGGNYIDTAHVYGDFATPRNGESERVIGRWMNDRKNREELFLSTKGAHHVLGTEPVGRLGREELRRDFYESLEALETDRVDIYWLHRDNPAYSVGEVMENLQELAESGGTRYLGASNWSTRRITEANEYAASHGRTPFFANQPQFSLAVQTQPDDPSLVQADTEMLRMHERTKMLMTPYSSQAKGFLTKLDTLGEQGLPEKVKRRFHTPENLGIYSRCKQVSQKTGLSVGAIALLWLTAQPFPMVPIIGPRTPEQLDLFREASEAKLSAEDAKYIRSCL